MATILIVDDRATNRQFLSALLGYGGYRLLEAHDGFEALQVARTERLDLIITDILMPRMSGYELAHELHADPALTRIPVIFFSSTYVEREARALARASGVAYIIDKPSEPQVILNTVTMALGLAAHPVPRVQSEPLVVPADVLAHKLSAKLSELDAVGRRLARMVDLGLELALERDPLRILELCCHAARDILGAQYGAIGVLADDGRTLDPVLTSSPDPGASTRSEPLTIGTGPIARLLTDRLPVRLRDENATSDTLGLPLPLGPMGAFLGVPITTPSELYGFLCVTDKLDRDEFTSEDERIAQTLAAQVALAYENMLRSMEIEQHAAQLQLDMTDLKKAEVALRESEQQLSSIYNTVADVIFHLAVEKDGRYRFISVNQAFLSITGLDYDQVVGKRVAEVIPEPSLTLVLEKYGEAIREKRMVRWEETSEYPTGRLTGEVSVAPVFDDDGNCTYLVGAVHDITERQRAEEALAKERNLLRTVMDTLPDYISITDTESRYVLVNEAFARFLGAASPDEVVGKTVFDMSPRDLAEQFYAEDRGILETGQPMIDRESLTVDQKNIQRWHIVTKVPWRDRQGKIVGLMGIARDITGRKQAEVALWESEARTRLIVDTALDAVITIDSESRITGWNPQAATIFGWSRQEAIGPFLYDLIIPPRYREAHRKGMARFLETGEGPVLNTRLEISALRRDGREFPVELTITPIKIGEALTFSAFVRDITEHTRAEAGLRESEQRLRTVLENMPVMLDALDENGHFIVWNKECERVTGYRAEEFVNNPKASEILFPDRAYRERMQAELDAKGDDYRDWEWETTCKDGSVRVIAWSNISSRHPVPGWAKWGIGVDLTERKRREDELEAIATVSAALRAAPTPIDMRPIILDQVRDLLRADGAALAAPDPAGGEMVVELARGAWAHTTGVRLRPGEGIIGHVMATRRPYLSNDVQTDPHFAPADLLEGIRAVACVPLIAHEQLLGALWVGRIGVIADGEVRLLTAVADIAANALRRATLHEQTQQRLQRLAALRQIDTAINASLDLRVTFNVLLDQVLTQLRVDASAVLRLSPHTHTLNFAAGRGFRTKGIERSRLRLGEGYAGRAALERRTIQLPILVEEEPDFTRAPLLAGEDFQAYYGVPLVAKGRVEGVLEVFHRAPLTPDADWLDFLEALARQAAIAIDNAEMFTQLQRLNLNLTLAYDATIEGWSRALDLRDHETEGHTQRVTELTLQLARALGTFSEEELVHMRYGALLHDMGKMGVPDGILLKPGKLTDDEWVIMRQHPTLAYRMLAPITYLHPALDIPYCHHEKWDGTGYPRGLKGEQLPLAARLFAVVDVWDALRSDRPYRAGWPEEKVLEHIRSLAGTHFDPQAVEVFLKVIGG